MKPHRGTLILILGILGFIPCCLIGVICGPIAFFMGNGDLKQMDAGEMDPSGRGLTNTGRILGLVGAIICVVIYVIFIMVWLAGLAAKS